VAFPVSGFRTLLLAATKSMLKELLPITDRPLIWYASETEMPGLMMLGLEYGESKPLKGLHIYFDSGLFLE
jgi:UTP-glucose-1-phosphate uridylyltransferase